MPGIKISEFPVAEALTDVDLLEVIQYGESRRMTGAQLYTALAGDVAAEKQAALVAKNAAESARDAALIQAGVFTSESVGRAAVADGQAFKVQGDGDVAAYEYRRINSGASTLIASYPSLSAYTKVVSDVDAVASDALNRMPNSTDVIFGVTDEFGFSRFEVTLDSIKTKNVEVSTEGVFWGGNAIEDVGDLYAWAMVDEYGFIGVALSTEGTLLHSGDSATGGFSDNEIHELNANALATAAARKSAFNTEVARPVWDYNHFLMYGQSLSTGQEGWPALSKTARHGNLMLGDATRPVSGSAATFDPVGGSNALKPLVAAVQNASTGAVMTDVEVAALAAGAQNLGEDPLVGLVNFAKLQHNQRWLALNDTSKIFVASNCGVSGKTIEQLSKGASPELYLRLIDAAQTVKDIGTGQGKTYGVAGVAFLQGEYNYDTSNGGDATLAGYKAKLTQLYADIESDIVAGISGQSSPPLFLTYQTGAGYTRDANGLAIGMAQWELAKERRNWVLATPIYPYTDKGGHLDPNGYRWVGKQFGKIWHRIVQLGEDWEPLSPKTAVLKGREILISFHVPAPPLAFDTPYVQAIATDYAYKGFEVLADGVVVALSSVEIVSDCVIRITLAGEPIGTIQVRYAGQSSSGGGCLRDSDLTVADDKYEYSAGTGQYASANIPTLIGNPYPLHNWCIAFQIPVVAA